MEKHIKSEEKGNNKNKKIWIFIGIVISFLSLFIIGIAIGGITEITDELVNTTGNVTGVEIRASSAFYEGGISLTNKYIKNTDAINFSYLQNYPTACTSGQYISALSDTPTCGTPVGTTNSHKHDLTNITGTGNLDTDSTDDLITSTSFGGEISGTYNALWVNKMNWTTLQNYPSACASGNFITTLGDTITCAVPTDSNCSVSMSCANVAYDAEIVNATANKSLYWDDLNVPTDLNNKLTLDLSNITNKGNLDLDSTNDVLTNTAFGGGTFGVYNSLWCNYLNWTNLDNYPSACSAGQYVTTIGDTLTCSVPVGSTDSHKHDWTNITATPTNLDIDSTDDFLTDGSRAMSGNLNPATNNTLTLGNITNQWHQIFINQSCYNQGCTMTIYNNGSGLVIKG